VFNNSNIDVPPLPPILGLVRTPIPGTSTMPTFLPLNSGSYAFAYDFAVIEPPILRENSFAWTASLNVETIVPEPSTVAIWSLLGIGLVVGHRRRNCKVA